MALTFGWSVFVICLPAVLGVLYQQPEQIHLSYGDVPTEMWVTWVTQDYTSGSTVWYGQGDLQQRADGPVTKFIDGGKLHRTIYIHRAKMTGLKPGARYVYIVGGEDGWSEKFSFKALLDGTKWSPYLVVYGDMGNDNARALPMLQLDAMQGNFDIILHVGDFAYDMDTDNALVGDEFMRQVQSVAGYIPYMTCPGNHEQAYNFSNYRNRFTMPQNGDGTGMFYSWNIGPAHIVSFDTEIYFWGNTYDNIKRQYDWLEEDLKRANLPENRAARPWIITMGHKPMYCSSKDDGELCTNPKNPIRNGTAVFWPNLEDLFFKYGVDIEFYAHEHSYERLWPLYKSKVCNGSSTEPYTNPRAPVHIITGSAGDREGQTKFVQDETQWSAFRTDDYGWTNIKIANETHLNIQEVSIDKNGEIIDDVWLIKTKRGPGMYSC